MPGVCPIIGETEADAKRKLSALGDVSDPVAALKVLSDRLGHDLSGFPLDGPVPTLPPSTVMQGHAVTLSALAKKQNLSLRELRDFTATAMGHRLLCGTPEFVADGLEEWFLAGAADGFNLMPAWFPGAFDDFVDQVVPILQKRGLFRTEYTGRTLRDHLGLPRPPNSNLASKLTKQSSPCERRRRAGSLSPFGLNLHRDWPTGIINSLLRRRCRPRCH